MIGTKQLDLSFGGRRNIRVRRPKTVSQSRAQWWFQQMREAVEHAGGREGQATRADQSR